MKKILFSIFALISSCTICTADHEQTLAIIKPDAVHHQKIGEIIARYERTDLHITGMKMVQLTQKDAETFYEVHKQRPFFSNLVQFMTSGPVVILAVEGPDAVQRNREMIGATNPKQAKIGTLRSDYGSAVERNAVHGSDSVENGRKEIAFFFEKQELCRGER